MDNDSNNSLLTHHNDIEFNTEILKNKNLSINNETIKAYIEQLAEFEFGRFLLTHKGVNGYWTSYVINNFQGKKPPNKLTELENWLLNKCPEVIANRERFNIFKQQTQSILKSNTNIASIPCGVMDDLLTLDYASLKNINIYGIDLDQKSLQLAENNYNLINTEHDNLFIKNNIKADLLNKNAWQLGFVEHFDLITSTGLIGYIKDNDSLIGLLKEFYSNLKPNGVLITSFLTPPPDIDPNSPWQNYSQEDLVKQRILFSEIIGVKWQTYRTTELAAEQLKQAGFKKTKFFYDHQKMNPTVIAYK